MQLFTVFEPWLIPDKAYPPLSKGDVVRLSFRMECRRLQNASERQEEFTHLQDAEYRFSGRVALLYGDNPDPFIVVETLGFRFYTQARAPLRPKRNSWICGEGTLLLDYGDWSAHFLPWSPSLFFRFRVAKLWKVRIPERFIQRGEGRLGHPSYLRPGDYAREHLDQVVTMVGEPIDEIFYIVELDDTPFVNQESA